MASLRATCTTIVAKLVVTAVVVLIAGMPTWLFLLARYVLLPEGFWQNFILGAVAVGLWGGLQITLVIGGVILLISIWSP